MAYELKQELRLKQSLVMTPQLQLAIKLLQLSRLELVETVREEVQTNPVLEEAVETDAETPKELTPAPEKQEVDWESYLEKQAEYRPTGIDFNRPDEEDDFLSNVSSAGGSLSEHLAWQLQMSGLRDDELRTGEYIIGNVGEDGYLRLIDKDSSMTDDEYERETVEEIARQTGVEPATVEKVLGVVQRFDPLGVCSRHLRECLLTQARQLPVRDTVVEEVIQNHLEKLGRKNYKVIARALGVSVEEIYEAVKTISGCLNPNPGSGFGTDDSRAIIPDVYIHKVGDEYVITLNEDGMPKLKISSYYRQLLKDNGTGPDEKARGYIQDKFRSALWLIKSVHQRQRTIYRVVECIVRFQKDFLDHGLKCLKPFILKDVAEEIGVHESTVSRVTSNKYVQTPRGIFELKYFFSTGMSASDGSDLAVEYIKEKLREIIKAEDAKNPLSDKQIVELLKESGIVVARRTAAKYREALGFLSSSRRKVHY
ncbi:MAG: RNA polymerase factor sigma-54 [Thermodesulfobacteriota bacterium]